MTGHAAHALMLVGPLLVLAGLFALEWRRTAEAPLPWTTRLAVTTTAVAAVVHAAAVSEHAHGAAVLAWAFVALAAAQGTWALAVLLAPRPGVLLAGVVGNLAVVALWAWTRTAGVPLGVAGGHREAVGALDLLATGMEAVAALAAARSYSATGGWPVPGSPVPWSKWARSTTRNSPPPRKTSTPSGSRPSHVTKSLRPSRRSIRATSS